MKTVTSAYISSLPSLFMLLINLFIDNGYLCCFIYKTKPFALKLPFIVMSGVKKMID